MTIRRIEDSARFAQVAVANGFAFIAGQVAPDLTQDTKGQTRQVLARIDELLRLAGTDKRSLVSVTVYLAAAADFADMNAAWDEWVDPTARPTRATVEAKLVVPEFRVEMQAIALVPR
jgi:enamine deaminase RidA (YjgF/YER057c/UK114 family)